MISQIPWIEKYRPSKLEDIILDEHTNKKVKKILTDLDMPNIILPGVPGIGKTTTIKCITRAFYGKFMNEAVLELNASDDRGIKAVQDKITSFCQKKMDLNERGDATRPYSRHKIIFLDEADNMTNKAQGLICTLMEKYHKTTRFAFTCNTSSDIIESIQSRCIILRFYRLRDEQIIKRLKYICDIEKVDITDECLKTIANIAEGDLRMAINNLQLVYRSCDEITEDAIYHICSKPQPAMIKTIITSCMSRDIIDSKNKILELKTRGYSESDIILGLINIIKNSKDIDDKIKMEYLEKVSYYAYIISKGIISPIQLVACVASLCSV